MGDRVNRWDERRRTLERDEELVPLLAFTLEPWTSTRTELDGALVDEIARRLQTILCEDVD